jgi:hypothetical protein
VIVPEGDQTAEQIGTAEKGTVGGEGCTEHQMVSAACARVAAIKLEFFCAKSAVPRVFINPGSNLFQFLPA